MTFLVSVNISKLLLLEHLLPQLETERKRLIQRNPEDGHLLKAVFDIMDGTRIPCASYKNTDMLNAFWEGFTQALEVINLFVWSFCGDCRKIQPTVNLVLQPKLIIRPILFTFSSPSRL